MSIDACAELVARGDPDRFASAMTAPVDLRGRLMVLYAFNLEVARAPWVTQEPMIAEMRIQWWVDAIAEIYEDRNPRRHEVVTPLVDVIRQAELPRAPFDALMQARRQDIYREPIGHEALWEYLGATSGGLVELAAKALGAGDPAQALAHRFGQGIGAANLLASVPGLNWKVVETPDDVRALALRAKAELRSARKDRALVSNAVRAAFMVGWQADAILARADKSPDHVFTGALKMSEFRRRASLSWRVATGRW